MGVQKCRTCGAEFEIHGQGPYKYCEPHRVSRADAKARDQRSLRIRRREARSPAICRVCGGTFVAKRSDANKCSDACKRLDLNRRARESEQRHRGHCADCGVEVARRSERCKKCAAKIGSQKRSRENSTHWKGGRSRSKGYVYLLVAPEARKGHRYRAEHILVWENTNGKPLPKGWVVHHKNGIKDDNRPENLQALPRGKHNHHDRRIALLEEQLKRIKAELKALHQLKMEAAP